MMTRNGDTEGILKELLRSTCMVHFNIMFSNLGLQAAPSFHMTKLSYADLSSSMFYICSTLIDYLVMRLTGILSTVRTM